MASIAAFIRTNKKKPGNVCIRFRLRDGRKIQLFHKSEIEINPAIWDDKKQEVKAKVLIDSKERIRINTSVSKRKILLLQIYEDIKNKEKLNSNIFESEIDKTLFPGKYQSKETYLFDDFEEFLEKRDLSPHRKISYKVVLRVLKRYELYKKTFDSDFKLGFDMLTPLVLQDIELYLKNEHKLYIDFPLIYEAVPESRKPLPRGQNTINDFFTKLRSFILWSIKVNKNTNNPFKNFSVKECVYGTPYYITIDERNKIFNTNLSRHPELEIYRDIFVFQCLIGCRVSDLFRLTNANIINGAIEYIARKTKDGRPITVRVPLNNIANKIIDKYHGGNEKLLPFPKNEQSYNKAIKRIFLAAKITRPVTIINPTTREPEIRPINEIASSHLARRCFVGNLYKKVKDPNLVGALSGHKEGSKAFSRYREIDEEMKTELVKLLE